MFQKLGYIYTFSFSRCYFSSNSESMATKPIPTFVYSPNPSKPFTKIPFNICSKPFRSSSSSTSLSRSGSLAIKCINNGNANTSSDKRREELKNYLAGIPDDLPNIHELSGIADELLKCEEIRVLFDGLINNSTKRVEPTKIKKQEVKMKKMKHYINQLETKVAEVCVSLCTIYLYAIFWHSMCLIICDFVLVYKIINALVLP